MKVLILTDMQEGYMNEASKKLVGKVKDYVESQSYDLILATRFINQNHSLYQSEVNKKMMMCSSETKMIEGINEIADIVLVKSTYSSLTEDVLKLIEKNHIKEVDLAGVNLETSIMATAFALIDKGIKPKILEPLCFSQEGKMATAAAIQLLKIALGEDSIVES